MSNKEKEHHFLPSVAAKYGIPEAILLYNISFWIEKNKANDKNCHDGRTWTYNSTKAYAKLFPYFSAHQVRRILDSLIENGVLIAGNYNSYPCDRTRWFAFVDESSWLYHQNDLAESSNENDDSVKSTNTDINTNINKANKQKLSSKEVIFDAWMLEVIKEGGKPIPEEHEVFKYAEAIQLPQDYVRLCWLEFKRTFHGNFKKKYIDWSKTFSNYVRKNYFGLWFEKDGAWLLTTAGKQLQKEMRDA